MSVPMGGGYNRDYPTVDVNWISKGWAYFMDRPWAWVGAMGLIFGVVILISLIMAVVVLLIFKYSGAGNSTFTPAVSPFAGPGAPAFDGGALAVLLGVNFLFAIARALFVIGCVCGLCRMAVRQVRGEVISAFDVFSFSDILLPMVGLYFLTSILVSIGMGICFIPGFIVAGVLKFAPFILIDRRVGVIDAMNTSYQMLKSQWLMAAVFVLLLGLINLGGMLALGVGIFVTVPLSLLTMAYAYVNLSHHSPGGPVTLNYAQSVEGIWPPPPSSVRPASEPFGSNLPLPGEYAPYNPPPPPDGAS